MDSLYSIRMRSAQGGPHERGGRHISGAERIVEVNDLEAMAASMIERALHHSKGVADFINISIEAVNYDDIHRINSLQVEEHHTNSLQASHALAKELLCETIAEVAVESAFTMLQGLKENMRGAILVDAMTGERIDKTGQKGIRVTRMDVCGVRPKTVKTIQTDEVFMNINMAEALVLASKVQSCAGIVGELCWSDDPDYTVGYVACDHIYHRLPHMKHMGSHIGGRVFFVDPNVSVDHIIQYLENMPVLVTFN